MMRSHEGYWDPQTSTVDWCESNYTVTRYCAEAINASTNLLFLYLGLKGIAKYRHDPILLISYIGYLTVGIGSFLFHATLKYSMQLLDELPMIWTASILLYASLSRSVAYPARFSTGITVATVGITVFYLYFAIPEILFISFGALLVAVLIVNLLKKTSESPDKKIVSKMKWIGIPMLAFGFACWMVDRHFCETLQAWREAVGQPWATLLELHGWWHLAMGNCCHYAILWVDDMEDIPLA
ncbi:putative alkaline ceramidase protein [Rutstroemia sp. NJR-2017a BBW]|nr:putative alkaline ceramidase protein [Rutstroemia sp. NJR-2017a BBW]